LTATGLFRRILGALDQAQIPYMLTGSFASSFHGAPRATQDIDLVISPTTEQVRRLVALLPPSEYYVDEEAALDALGREGQFNVVDFASGWKIDLIIRKSRPFSRQEFERRQFVPFEGMRFAVATPEDLIVAKLEWASLGESRRQIEDAATILRIRAGELDLQHVGDWARELGVSRQLDEALRLAGGSG
jgi:hypothetical protein